MKVLTVCRCRHPSSSASSRMILDSSLIWSRCSKSTVLKKKTQNPDSCIGQCGLIVWQFWTKKASVELLLLSWCRRLQWRHTEGRRLLTCRWGPFTKLWEVFTAFISRAPKHQRSCERVWYLTSCILVHWCVLRIISPGPDVLCSCWRLSSGGGGTEKVCVALSTFMVPGMLYVEQDLFLLFFWFSLHLILSVLFLFRHFYEGSFSLFSVDDTVQESWPCPHVGHPVLPERRRACKCP